MASSIRAFRRSAIIGQPARAVNLTELLLSIAARYPRAGMCFVAEDRQAILLTYPTLLEEARRILGGLRAHGRPVGAKVVLLLERAADFIPAFWACVLGGYVPCSLAPIRGDAERWARHLSHIDSLLEQPLLVSTYALREELPESVIAADLDTLRRSAPADPMHHATADDPAVLVLTSGSTGNSKAVVLTHGNLLASMAGKVGLRQLDAADATLNWISFDHIAALSEAHLLPLYAGAMQLHADPAAILADPLLFLRLIDRYRVSMTFTPNFLLGQINAALSGADDDRRASLGIDLSCVRQIISGGEAIVVDTGQRFLDLLIPHGLPRSALWPAFGMTETCAGCVYSQQFPDGDAGREFASLGLPIAGLQMRIVDDHGAIVGAGEPGELQLRGPMVFQQYYRNEEATQAAFTVDGWFRTGDLGRIDAGKLSLVGRSKDSIIVSGVNYFSHELETVLQQLDGIERSFVAAFPTRPKGADTERLVVAFAASFSLDDEDRLHQLAVAIRNTTILLWGFRPALILPLPKEALPKTSLGKIQRGLLRKRLEAGDLAAHEEHIAAVTGRQLGGYIAPVTGTESTIAAIYAQMFGLDLSTVSATASFFDLGGTSLDIIMLKRKLETQLALSDLPIATILQHPTVRELAACTAPERRRRPRDYDPVVPLQTSGRKTPLFCVHPGAGEVLVFVNLARYFVNERPFYALRARGFEPGEPYFDTFDEMVGTYVDGIRRRQPQGPYAIAGYSFGGVVAFEIAKRLESQGEEVAFTASIDMAPLIMSEMGKIDAVENAVLLALFLSLIDEKQSRELPSQLRAAAPHQDPCAYLIQAAPPERLAALDLDLPKFKAWADVARSLLPIGRSYHPSGKVAAMTVFVADPLRGTRQEWLNEHLKRWDDFTRTPNRYVDVPGEHFTLLGPKYLARFQALLRGEIDLALGGR